ncbi:YrrS family protein [Alkalihalobacillus sp. BA299]|uniref:YrrS family protein n=1 Tax=Alkalihalobacillus sp. BA299 TaxID=2815938 RepID=UPI001AD96F71|nr:YrrS family protein [Alkalihalobacillus sp. BA299]
MNSLTRYEQRKKRRLNRLLNVAIGIVAILIIYFAVQLLFSSGSSEEVIADHGQEEQQQEQTEEIPKQTHEENKDIDSAQDEATRNEAENEDIREEDVEDVEESFEEEVQYGEWEPIGTVQSEPFEINFSKDHVNWKEMTHALQYATGLGDDIILWRIENGGDSQSAVGTVSDPENKHTPYRVRIEWVPERGWKPVEVIQLSENPYLSQS